MVSVLERVGGGELQGPARRAALLVAAFGGWTLLVWLGRIRNIVVDDALSGGGRAWRLLLAAVFVGGAVDVLVRLWGARSRMRARHTADGVAGVDVPRVLLRSVALLALFTIVVWLQRAVAILLADHAGGFKAVHTVLAVGSIALAVVAWQAIAPRSPGGARSR